MDEATRCHWELIADQCFDRAYQGAQRTVELKAANGQEHPVVQGVANAASPQRPAA